MGKKIKVPCTWNSCGREAKDDILVVLGIVPAEEAFCFECKVEFGKKLVDQTVEHYIKLWNKEK